MKLFKTLIFTSIIAGTGLFTSAQTIHQVCISPIQTTGGVCPNGTGIFTPGNLTIDVGDQIQFTTVIAGKAFEKSSPVPVYSDLFMIEVQAKEDFVFKDEGQLYGDIAIIVINGEVEANGEQISKGNMLVSKDHLCCNLTIKKGAHLLIFGGEPFENERFIHWNFVSSSKDRIEQAKKDWQNDQFPLIEGDNSYVPLP